MEQMKKMMDFMSGGNRSMCGIYVASGRLIKRRSSAERESY
jgi:hypothetical protein